MHKVDDFLSSQLKLAQYIRKPAEYTPDEMWPADRAKVYADLVFNNIEDFLARFFPVLKEITPPTYWRAMVRDFVAHHQSKTPLFLELAQEFLDYLEHERRDNADPAFLLELAHYEWVELALDVSEEHLPEAGYDASLNLLSHSIYLSPLVCSLAYHYPVHRIGPSYIPTEPPAQPTFLLVYRDAHDNVKFMEINAVTARLLELIEAHPEQTGEQLLLQLADEIQLPSMQILASGEETLTQLLQAGVILGGRVLTSSGA